MRTIIVSGALANRALNGGGAWVRLSYVRGFQRLGFNVCFVEQIDRGACVDRHGQICPFEDSINLAYFEQVTGQFGLKGALIYEAGDKIYGATLAQLRATASEAELLVNISGHLTWEPLFQLIRCRAYVDLDPGFTQFWADGNAEAHLDDHDFYFTIGENIGSASCPIPTGDRHWRATRPPVVLDDWPVARHQGPVAFTTVGALRGPFGAIQRGGRTYGLKVHELRKFASLPRLVDRRFELALGIHQDDEGDRQLLSDNGWQIVDPHRAVPDPGAFRRYVQASAAEFSVAQGMYVDTASGWCSDRTVRYLASGRPALVQETGFSRNLPVGEGLLAFQTVEQAVAGADAIVSDYRAHCLAARSVAEACFNSDIVLGRLIHDVGLRP